MANQDKLFPDPDLKAEFPSDLIDPERKKSKEYALNYSKAVYARAKLDLGYFSTTRILDFIANRQYAKGNQPIAKYTRKLSYLKNEQGQDVSYLNLDHTIVSVIPKFRDVVLSYMAKMDFDIYVDAVNPKASNARREIKNDLRAKAELKPFWDEMAAKANNPEMADKDDGYVPQSEQEIEMWLQLGHRLPEETAMELLVRAVMLDNDWGDDAQLVREDIFDNGLAFGSQFIDPVSKKLKMRYEDPVNGIFQNFRGKNGTRGMTRIGVRRKLTIAQLKLEAGNQFTEDEYYNMAKLFCGWYGNPAQIAPYTEYVNTDAENVFMEYDNYEVIVQDMEWDSCDRIKIETQTYEDGEILKVIQPFKTPLGKKDIKNKDGETLYASHVRPTSVKSIYGAKWVIGTDYIYDYGKAKNIARTNDNNREPQKRFKLYRIFTKSPLERIIEYADSIQLSWMKMQNLKARAMPKGLIIDIGAFENIFLDNKKISARELLEMAVQTGIIITRQGSTMDDDGVDRVGKPVEETEGGIGSEFEQLNNSILSDIQMIQQITGVNSSMDASSPDPNTLVGNQKIALAGSANALFPLLQGFVKFTEMMATGIILNGLHLAKHKKLTELYGEAIGEEMCNYLETMMEDDTPESPCNMGTRIEGRPTQEVKQRLFQMVQAALSSSQDPNNGGIEFPFALELDRMIENNDPPKLIEATARYRISQFKKQAAQIAAQNAQAAAEATAKAKQDSIQSEIALLKEKAAIEKDLYTHKTNEDIRKEEKLHPLILEEKIADVMGEKDLATHDALLEDKKKE